MDCYKKAVLVRSVFLGLVMLSFCFNANAKKTDFSETMFPIILMILEENQQGLFLNVGLKNDVVVRGAGFSGDVQSQFSEVSNGLALSFNVAGLAVRQKLEVFINGNFIGEVTENREYQFQVTNDVLNSNSDNVLSFHQNIPNGEWEISQLNLQDEEGPLTRAQAVRFLNKATFGADEASIDSLLNLGYSAWVNSQLNSGIKSLHTPFYLQAVSEHASVGISGASQRCASKMDTWWESAVNGQDQLRQRMAFALSEIFVIGDMDCNTPRLHGFTTFYDVLVDNALGSYRELLEGVTLNPMMGSWLSLRGSNASPVYGNNADENYAREVMQLFSIGVHELNLDGSLKLKDGKPIETYDHETVTDMARALTGWQRDDRFSYSDNVLHPMVPWGGLYAPWHDYGEKTILSGVYIPAGFRDPLAHLKDESEWLHFGNTVVEDTALVLDTIAAHNNVAPFISKQLIQRFVTSNPSPAYIARVATVFNDNGFGVKGDLGAVIKTILLDTEAINSHQNVDGGKMKEPLLMVTQIWRAFEAKSPVKYIRFLHAKRFLGQQPMGADSVFNFYRPDYAPAGELTEKGLVAPEMFLFNDYQLLQFYPKMQDILDSLITIDSQDIINGQYNSTFNINLQLDLTTAKSLATDTTLLMDYFDELMFGGLMSDGLRGVVSDYIDNEVSYDDGVGSDEWREQKVEEALFLLGVSPEFMVQQ